MQAVRSSWIAILGLAACGANPATGIGSSGLPMRLRYAQGTGTYQSNDVVEENKIVNSETGEDTGLTEQKTALVTHSYHWQDWTYYQGKLELDEQDYFRLAGDDDAYREVQRIRRNDKLKEYLGGALAILGAGVGFYGVGDYKGQGNHVKSKPAVYGGFGVAIAGMYTFMWGAYDLKREHQLSTTRADADADLITECNEGRCHTLRGGGPSNPALHRPPVERTEAPLAPPPPPPPAHGIFDRRD